MAMKILTPPGKISSQQLLSGGATGWVYQINDRVVLKYAVKPGSEEFARENNMFDLFEKHPPHPHVIQSFLRLPNANFLAFMSGGSLDARLRSNQIRDGYFGKVLRVVKTEPVELVKRWLKELCSAVVWLESLGYVHGDLRPANLLLDERDHLKLADFDCAEKVGTSSSGNAPPWARVLGEDAGSEGRKGSFGTNGPRTEQFAIGSNLYCMVYGLEPYEDRDDRGPVIVDLFQAMKFPELQDGPLNSIIDRCWRGQYQQLKDLLEEAETLSGAIPSSETATVSTEYLDARRKECQALVEGGLLGDI
ncbi:kinase domain-containing protein [Hypoxylon sp. FL0543]|nr:kinase domain-containing protein [Hypoxylon sp. FL0543]